MKKKLLAGSAIIIFLATWTGFAEASFAFTHSGATDPSLEGFGLASSGPSTIEPITNDMGLGAWSVSAGQTTQIYYLSGALSSMQAADITNQGFDLTLTARILPGTAPSYTAATPYVFAFADFQSSSKRFDIMLGVNHQGETVVVLPTYFVVDGITAQAFGPNFTLSNSSEYHTYKLAYDPNTQLANLLVDSVEVINNYAGNSMYLSNWGLGWGVVYGGQSNFNFVQFSSPVPIPGAAWLFGSALVGLVSFSRRKSLHSWRVW